MQGCTRWNGQVGGRAGAGFALALAVALVTGCSSQITNLTPSVLPRESSGLYHFETEWTSNQRSLQLRSADIQALVGVNGKFYPMERVPQMTNRWEAEVPLTNSPVYYQYKWNYVTAGFGRDRAHPNSLRSQEYRLEVVDSLKPATPAAVAAPSATSAAKP